MPARKWETGCTRFRFSRRPGRVGSVQNDELSGAVGLWGERSMSAFVVGAPPVMLLQRLTGSSRPGETSHDSSWSFWSDNNGVSGHAFMSALPFVTAAKATESPLWKTVFYAGSTLGPLCA